MLDCGDRCSIRVQTSKEGRLRLRGVEEHPFTQGFTCAKIRRYPARLRHPERITRPWIREEGGGFRPAGWEEAMRRVVGALEKSLAEPRSVLMVRGSGSMGQGKLYADYLFRRLGARLTRGSLCDGAGIEAVERDTGTLLMNHPSEIDAAQAIILWGRHPRAASIHTLRQVLRARSRGARVIGVNPDTAAVSEVCDEVIRVRPGTDRLLALAAAKLLLEQRPAPPALEEAANGADFVALLDRLQVDELLQSCDVDRKGAELLAGTYLTTTKVATICGWALQRYDQGGETVRAIHALAYLAGSVGAPGGGFYYGVSSGRLFRPLRRMEGARTDADTDLDLRLPVIAQDLLSADPPLSFVWFTASNLLNQAPDALTVRQAFERVPTRVAVEGFWTDTAQAATAVLPPALWLEEEDLVGSYWFPVIGAVRRFADPPPACRSDFEILKRLEADLGLDSPYADLRSWLAGRLTDEAPELDDLWRDGWWIPDEDPVAGRGGFAHLDGRFRFLDTVSTPPDTDDGRPALLSLIRRDALHSQMLPEEQSGPLEVRIHPDRAASLGVKSGGAAILSNERAELPVRVRQDEGLHPEAVACPRDGWIRLGLGPNVLTEARLTDMGETAAYYETRVTLAPATGEPAEAREKHRSNRPEES
ncbi:MAG: molybdopterin-dependent oxidoreductase [Thermoleophilia bacterium]